MNLAILNACIVEAKMHYSKIIIVSDNKLVIDSILGSWKILGIVEDIKYHLNASICFSFVWVNCEINHVAHSGDC